MHRDLALAESNGPGQGTQQSVLYSRCSSIIVTITCEDKVRVEAGTGAWRGQGIVPIDKLAQTDGQRRVGEQIKVCDI